ncbi:MAG TPA: DUF4340 domain-containing protein [Thermoanaerobaculia bacterium]
MRPRTLLVLLVLVLGLGAFIWFYERDLPSSDERAEQAKKVLAVEKDEVQGVTIEAASGRVVLERVEGPKEEKEKKEEAGVEEVLGPPESEWRIVQPMAARADTFAVDGLLDALTTLEKTRTLDEVDRKALGLDNPRATVRLKTSEGEKVLRIGAAVPTGSSVIASLEGEDKAFVVSDSILSQLGREPGAWRDRQLFRASRDTISRITLTGPAGQVALAQKNDLFRVERPISDRADRDRVDDLYADLSGLTAEQFLDDPSRPPAELGLQPPQAVVEVAFKEGPPMRIELGSPASAEADPAAEVTEPGGPTLRYARIGAQVFETRTRLADAASRPPREWRARGLSGFEVHQVESVTVKDDKINLRLTRAGTDWKRGEETISYVPVSDFLFALTGAQSDQILSPAEARALGAGFAKPVLTVDLETKDAGKETVTLYPALAAGVPARVSGREPVLLLPRDKLQEIQSRLADVRNAKPLAAAENKP